MSSNTLPASFAPAAVAVLTLALIVGVPAIGDSSGDWLDIELLASDGASGDVLGGSVAISGDTALVGAPGHEDGSAYVFVRSGSSWVEQDQLTPSDGESGDYFGSSVALSGNVALVGSEGSGKAGSAYVFERFGNSWIERAKLQPSDGVAGQGFGLSLALSGNLAVVGSPNDNDSGFLSGSAYVFVGGGGLWLEQAKLVPSDGSSWDLFGGSVAVSGDTVLIGADPAQPVSAHGLHESRALSQAAALGAAYVFVPSEVDWVEEAKLSGFSGGFGVSVALSGDTALVGAYFDSEAAPYAGSVHVFVRSDDGWVPQTKLLASDGAMNNLFGASVALLDDVAFVGASFHSGSAYVFERSSGLAWSERVKVRADDGARGDEFGGAVALSEDTFVVGARLHDHNATNSGSAYVYSDPLLFGDSFESGTTSAWSVVVP